MIEKSRILLVLFNHEHFRFKNLNSYEKKVFLYNIFQFGISNSKHVDPLLKIRDSSNRPIDSKIKTFI